MSSTKICTFFLKEACSRGSTCRFKHVYGDDRTYQPGSESRCGTPKPSTQECRFFLQGRCTKGDQCAFKHSQKFSPKAASNPRTDKSKRFNKKQLILRNLHPDIIKDDIKEYVIQLASKCPSTLKFHHDNTAVMAGFRENIVIRISSITDEEICVMLVDINELRMKIGLKKSLQTIFGNEVQLDEVPFCNSILLWGIPVDTSKEDIECEVRRIMGPNSIDNVSYNDDDEFAIVTFKVTDLSTLRNANLFIGGRKLSFYFYDEGFVTSEIYHIIHGHTKKIKIIVNDEILGYLMEKRKGDLESIVKTSNFCKERSEQGCFLVITMENWKSDAEKKIRDAFKLFVSEYDTKQIPINPEILGIPENAVYRLFSSFIKSKESRRDVDVQRKNHNLFITGRVEDVKESVGNFEKLKANCLKSEQKKLVSAARNKRAQSILQKYPMFKKDCIIDFLKTDTKLSDEKLIKNVTTIARRYTEEDKLTFFQTEAFTNCRHRILKECHVVLAAQEHNDFKKKKTGVELGVIVDDISTITSDVIVNSTSKIIGSGGILANSLRTAAGQTYVSECTRRENETIDEWDYKKTAGGDLLCKDVFHAHLGSYNSEKFQNILVRIYKDAASMSHSSVAIPMLGTGAHHYAKEDVVKDVVRSVEIYNTESPDHSLKKVLLVIESSDKDSLPAIRNHFPNNSSTHVKSKSVEVIFLGIRDEDLTYAASILTRCFNEQTLNERVGLSMDTPTHWDKMPLGIDRKEEPFHLACLSIGSVEYNKVRNELMLASRNSIREILTIHRVQNPQLYKSYMIRKQDMDIRNGSHQNERSLFHGTTEEASKAINHHGFNRSYAGKNAAFYGDGNYFAVDSSYSVSYARPNARGEKLMYMAKVLVGEYTRGRPGMKAPPKKGMGTNLYDSVVNNVANPSIFVVFPDNHAYPEYLICFK